MNGRGITVGRPPLLSVERLVAGMGAEWDPQRCIRDVVQALGEQSFAGLETTRDAFGRVYWDPRFFERRSVGGWQAAGCPSIRREVHAKIRRLIARPDYALEADRQKAMDGILARARAHLT